MLPLLPIFGFTFYPPYLMSFSLSPLPTKQHNSPKGETKEEEEGEEGKGREVKIVDERLLAFRPPHVHNILSPPPSPKSVVIIFTAPNWFSQKARKNT
jgi:hypothetical protein